MKPIEQIRPIIEAKLQAMGLELYDMKLHPAGRKSILRVHIDKPSGVTVLDCETASRELSVVLDVEEFSSTPYSLEVSSPGADRLLQTQRDFLRVKGRAIAVDASESPSTTLHHEGTVVSCTESVLELSSQAGSVVLPLTSIKNARVILRF